MLLLIMLIKVNITQSYKTTQNFSTLNSVDIVDVLKVELSGNDSKDCSLLFLSNQSNVTSSGIQDSRFVSHGARQLDGHTSQS